MKKILFIVLLLCINLSYSAEWKSFFDDKYIDFENITTNNKENTITFWAKNIYKTNKPKIENRKIDMSVHKWVIDCKNKKSNIQSSRLYKNNNLVYSEDNIKDFQDIAPDTYADAYYRMFCLIPFEENPLINSKH